MNSLISNNLSVGEYFDFTEWDTALINPDDPSAGSKIILTQDGVERLTHDAMALFNSVHQKDLLDPVSFIRSSIRKMIDNSSASPETKARVDSQTRVKVRVIKGRPGPGGLTGANLKPEIDEQPFTIEDIVTDIYRRKLTGDTEVRVVWPRDFPEDLVSKLESANLQASYEAEVTRTLKTPEARFMIKLQTRMEVEERIKYCVDHPNLDDKYKALAGAYFRGEAILRVVQFWSAYSRVTTSDVLFLQKPGDESADGLLIFLGEPKEASILALPQQGRRWLIENWPALAKKILKRLPLSHQRRKGNEKLAYHYLTFSTVGKPQLISPLQFQKHEDVFEVLYTARISRLLSDIDTLVSTDGERLADDLLTIGVALASGISIMASVAAVAQGTLGYALAAFMAGQSASALRIIQAANFGDADELRAVVVREAAIVFLRAAATIYAFLLGDVVESVIESPTFVHLTSELTGHLSLASGSLSFDV